MPASQRTLERRIRAVYEEAQGDLQKKLDAYIARFREKDARKRKDLSAGKITQQQYDEWRQGAIFQGKAWRARVKQVTDTLANANEESLRIVRGEQMQEFADGFNHEQFVLDQNTGIQTNFGIYDADTVAMLIRDQPDLLPPKKLNRGKDERWNQKKVTGSILQGIIQGESIDDIARRIARDTAQQNSKAMIRYARTATTGAQNAGRMETMHRAQGMGINVRKQWLATLDARTRHSHRHLDGEVADIDKPFRSDFGNIMFPGDPSAHPGDVYNCRCTMVYVYPDYPTDPGERLDNVTGEHVRGDMTYAEWAGMQSAAKPKKKPEKGKSKITFSEKMDDPKWDKAKKRILELENEFETKLKTVRPGSQKSAGSVQISGSIMELSSTEEYVAIHEFAHSISLSKQTKYGLADESDFWKEIRSVYRAYHKDVDMKQDHNLWISSYEHSERSVDEFMADAFALAYLRKKGIPIPSRYGRDVKYSDKVLKIIIQRFGKKGKGL